jgi:lysophospholipase L1-like esterase
MKPFRWLAVISFMIFAGAAWGQIGPGGAPSSYLGARNLVIYGDSFAANAGYSQAALPCGQFCGTAISGNYFTWTMIYSNYRVSMTQIAPWSGTVTNCGVSGQTTAQILANIGCVLAVKPDVVMMDGGTNDAAVNLTCATITANNRRIYQTLAAAGIYVVKMSIIPRSGASVFTTAQANVAQCANEYDRRYAEYTGTKQFYFVDLDPIVVDPAQTTWSIRAGYLVDGTHPSTAGGSVMGYAIAGVLNQLFPSWRGPIMNAGDVYDAVNNPTGNLLPNGAMTGTSGTLTGCTGVAVGTSGSTNSLIGSTAGGASCVGSSVTTSDGRSAQQVVISGAATGSGNYVAIRNAVTTPSNISIGDVIEAQAWVTVGANTNLAGFELNMNSTESGTQYNSSAALANQTDPLPTAGFADGVQHVLITARRTILAVPTGLFVDVRVKLINGSVSPTGTITVSSVSIRKVLQ